MLLQHLTIRRRAIPICWTPSTATPPWKNGPSQKLQKQRKAFGERQPRLQSPGARCRRVATGGHRSTDSGFGCSPIFGRARPILNRKQRPGRLVHALPDRGDYVRPGNCLLIERKPGRSQPVKARAALRWRRASLDRQAWARRTLRTQCAESSSATATLS